MRKALTAILLSLLTFTGSVAPTSPALPAAIQVVQA